MTATDYAWLGWFAMLALVEGYAIWAKRNGGHNEHTLTDVVRAFLRTGTPAKVLFGTFLAWLAGHFYGLW